MSGSNCCFVTCIQISQEAGKVVWYSHLFKNFPQFVVIHIVKGFGTVNKAGVDVFLELFCFFDDPKKDFGERGEYFQELGPLFNLYGLGAVMASVGVSFSLLMCCNEQCKRPGLDPWVGKIPWRREWQSTPVFLPGEFHRQRSLAGYSSYCC